ncbi:DUF4303 domain-containing protein [Halovulum sp. GXIMD14793]
MPDEIRSQIRWSYADSPYCGFGQDCFAAVSALFDQRGSLYDHSARDADDEYRFRLNAMEKAMMQLDREGLFGEGKARERCTIHVEVMPPDETNTDRAIRLNSKSALSTWLREMSE